MLCSLRSSYIVVAVVRCKGFKTSQSVVLYKNISNFNDYDGNISCFFFQVVAYNCGGVGLARIFGGGGDICLYMWRAALGGGDTFHRTYGISSLRRTLGHGPVGLPLNNGPGYGGTGEATVLVTQARIRGGGGLGARAPLDPQR